MAKKKNRQRQRTAQKRRQPTTKITRKDVEQGRDAIKTMIKGAVYLALFICFFALKIGDQTMYERASGLFSGDESADSKPAGERSAK